MRIHSPTSRPWQNSDTSTYFCSLGLIQPQQQSVLGDPCGATLCHTDFRCHHPLQQTCAGYAGSCRVLPCHLHGRWVYSKVHLSQWIKRAPRYQPGNFYDSAWYIQHLAFQNGHPSGTDQAHSCLTLVIWWKPMHWRDLVASWAWWLIPLIA